MCLHMPICTLSSRVFSARTRATNIPKESRTGKSIAGRAEYEAIARASPRADRSLASAPFFISKFFENERYRKKKKSHNRSFPLLNLRLKYFYRDSLSFSCSHCSRAPQCNEADDSIIFLIHQVRGSTGSNAIVD